MIFSTDWLNLPDGFLPIPSRRYRSYRGGDNSGMLSWSLGYGKKPARFGRSTVESAAQGRGLG